MSSPQEPDIDLPLPEKLRALSRVARFQPLFAASVVTLSVVAALLDAFGLSFILPIIEIAQAGGSRPSDPDGLLALFMTAYDLLGIPFTMAYLVGGVIGVMLVRFTSSFLVGWFRAAIETRYVRYLQSETFDHALDARIAYFDEKGSDEILNTIVTQSEYAGRVIRFTLHTIEQGLLALAYLLIALYLAPLLTVVTVVFLGVATLGFRNVLDSGYSIGDRVADAKERIQINAQAGMQGIREVKLFGMTDELRSEFERAVETFERSQITLRRNEALIKNFYQFTTAVSIFVLIFVALTFSSLTLGALGVFLFAMFRLGPKLSHLNRHFYRAEGELPHLVRTQRFLDELQTNVEPTGAGEPVPDTLDPIEFKSVSFAYDSEAEPVLDDISFTINQGDFLACVGPSGAGKSTIVSLLIRMYEPDEGTIQANGRPIADFDTTAWRRRLSVVRQEPHIFNDTLEWNLTIGNPDATRAEIEHACEIAQVTEFFDELPHGFESHLGDQGVKLSGGQRQRIALARALLKPTEVLVLDEATSHLDTDLERKVHRGIEAMDDDATLLVIAHRLSTVTNADRILTLEDGQIKESGSHDELLSKDGTYSRLYSLQRR